MRKVLTYIYECFWKQIDGRKPGEIAGLKYTIRTTAKCRFNAEKRLKFKNNIETGISILVSLILILIPLLQLADVSFSGNGKLIVALQTFLAVVMLVYSIIISKEKYDERRYKLNSCGNELKKLIRKLNRYDNIDDENISDEIRKEIDTIAYKYSQILNTSENHENEDYWKAKLDLKESPVPCIRAILIYIMIFINRCRENKFSIVILLMVVSFLLFILVNFSNVIEKL